MIPAFLKEFVRSRISGMMQAQGKKIPFVKLQEKHIRNLKVVVDRSTLLGLLPANAIVAELGVDHGDFSAKILSIAKPQKLHLVDVWGSERYHDGLSKLVNEKFSKEIATNQVVINRGYSTDEMAKFPDNYFDWVYIDTDHTYNTTAAELAISAKKVKKGGIIAGHDYVTGSIDRVTRYGVVEAVHEFCVKNNWEMVYITHETHRYLSFAIREITN